MRDLDGGEGAVLVVGFEVVAKSGEGVFVGRPARVPDEAVGVTVKFVFLEKIERGGSAPVALVISAPEVAFGVAVDAIVHAEAITEGGEVSLGVAVEGGAFPFHGGEVATTASEFGVFAESVFGGGAVVGRGADGEVVAAVAVVGDGVGFMVVAGESPAGGEGAILVGGSVLIGVGSLGEFSHLGDAYFVTRKGVDAAAVVEASGKVLPIPLCGVGLWGGAEDVATAKNDEEGAVGSEVDGSHFGRAGLGESDVFDAVGGGEESLDLEGEES